MPDEGLRGRDEGNHMGRCRGGGWTPPRHHGAPCISKLPEVRERREGTEDRAGTCYGRELEDSGKHAAEVMEDPEVRMARRQPLDLWLGVAMSDPGKSHFREQKSSCKDLRGKKQRVWGWLPGGKR